MFVVEITMGTAEDGEIMAIGLSVHRNREAAREDIKERIAAARPNYRVGLRESIRVREMTIAEIEEWNASQEEGVE